PGTALMEMALYAARQVGLEGVQEAVMESPLALEAGRPQRIQLTVGPEEDGARSFVIRAKDDGDRPWKQHVTGSLGATPKVSPERLEGWPPAGARRVDLSGFYERIAASGVDYGPAFRGVTSVWQDDADICYVEAELPGDIAKETEDYALH